MATVEDVFQQGIKSHLTGNLATAAQCYAAVLQANPGSADPWHLAGLVAHQCGRSQDGRQYIERAIELNPNNAEYHSNLAAVLRALQQTQAALSAADAAVRVDPNFAAAWHQRGTVLLDLDRTQEAIESYRRALDAGHSPASVWHEMGLALQYAGDIQGSIEHLKKSLQADPHQPTVYFRLAHAVRTGDYTFDDDHRRLMRDLIKANPTELKALGRLHFALAADCEARGDYAAALDHFRDANRFYCEFLVQQNANQQDRGEFGRVIERVMGLFNSDVFSKPRATTLAGPRPVFVVGMPRSGTTLVTQMLAQHSEIASAGELTTMATLVAQRQSDCVRTGTDLLADDWLRTAAECYLAELTSRVPDKSLVIDKLPENFRHLGFIASLFPQAKIIHCRRDPRDTCLSAFCQLFESDRLQMETGDLALLGENYRDYLRLMRHWRSVLPVDIHEISYERLVDDPAVQLRELLDFLDVPWSDKCLEFHDQASTVRTASSLQVRKPLYRSSLGRWKHYERHLGDLFDALGDALD